MEFLQELVLFLLGVVIGRSTWNGKQGSDSKREPR